MPHIFPKRHLRTRDVLDPEDLNEDFSPAQELVDGHLDGTNFDASQMKTGVTVAQGAYFVPYYQSVECDLSFGSDGGRSDVLSPNFVQDDGTTFRDHFPTDDGTTTPFVVPNEGGWIAIDNGSAGSPLQVTLTTGTSVLWVTAYLQYVWQGFFEPKESDQTGGHEEDEDKYIVDTWPTDDYPYAYPSFEGAMTLERKTPNLGGWHHRSRGGRSAGVQFAIRINGRVITRTITGKYDSTDGAPVGLKAGYDRDKTTAQRSFEQKSSFEEDEAVPGLKLTQTSAAWMGPEILPLRIGAAIPVAPGTHTIEIVARRSPTSRGTPRTRGDFIGVFTRRLLCLDLPNSPPTIDARSDADTIPDFDTELLLDQTVLHNQSAKRLRDRYNNIKKADVLRGSIPNTHLPSKVAYSKRVTITPTLTELDKKFWSDGWSRARWPGWRGGTTSGTGYTGARNDPDHVVTGRRYGWTHPFHDTTTGAGWYQLDEGGSSATSTKLEIDESATGKLNVTSDDILIVQADVFLRAIVPAESDFLGGLDRENAFNWLDYLNYNMPHKYLDLFSAFGLAYYDTDQSKWIIASEHRPAWVNHYNWFGRNPYYLNTKTTMAGFMTSIGGDTHDSTEADVRAVVRSVSFPTGFVEVGGGSPSLIDARGDQTTNLWQFVNVPLFWVIQGKNLNISKLSVFCCSNAPSFHFENGGTGFSTAPRDALKQVRTYWGRSSLTALKLNK